MQTHKQNNNIIINNNNNNNVKMVGVAQTLPVKKQSSNSVSSDMRSKGLVRLENISSTMQWNKTKLNPRSQMESTSTGDNFLIFHQQSLVPNELRSSKQIIRNNLFQESLKKSQLSMRFKGDDSTVKGEIFNRSTNKITMSKDNFEKRRIFLKNTEIPQLFSQTGTLDLSCLYPMKNYSEAFYSENQLLKERVQQQNDWVDKIIRENFQTTKSKIVGNKSSFPNALSNTQNVVINNNKVNADRTIKQHINQKFREYLDQNYSKYMVTQDDQRSTISTNVQQFQLAANKHLKDDQTNSSPGPMYRRYHKRDVVRANMKIRLNSVNQDLANQMQDIKAIEQTMQITHQEICNVDPNLFENSRQNMKISNFKKYTRNFLNNMTPPPPNTDHQLILIDQSYDQRSISVMKDSTKKDFNIAKQTKNNLSAGSPKKVDGKTLLARKTQMNQIKKRCTTMYLINLDQNGEESRKNRMVSEIKPKEKGNSISFVKNDLGNNQIQKQDSQITKNDQDQESQQENQSEENSQDQDQSVDLDDDDDDGADNESVDLNFQVCKKGRVEFLHSVYEGRPPTILFNYHPCCGRNRHKQRSELISVEEEKFYNLNFRFTWNQHPYTCVKNAFLCAGFTETAESDFNALWGIFKTGKVKNMNKFQKLCHFPGCWNIGRKDNLWKHLSKSKRKFPQDYLFIPNTYILAHQSDWDRFLTVQEHADQNHLWIMKPVASACGRGIKMVSQKTPVQQNSNYLVCQYIVHPHLIDGRKYDLRIYVAVTSYDPLRIYLYEQGLTRFATEKYSTNLTELSKRYVHLTNYSVNKNAQSFVKNVDPNADNVGSQWSITALKRQYVEMGIDVEGLFKKIKDIIIKTCISAQPYMADIYLKSSAHRSNCFELYGFDVLIDSALKPWLLEVNVCPSLSSSSPMDRKIKHSLLSDVYNLVGITPFDQKSYNMEDEKNIARARPKFSKNLNEIVDLDYNNCIEKLSPQDWEILFETDEEYYRRGSFQRIFPIPQGPAGTTDQMEYYLNLFEFKRYNNLMVYRWLKSSENFLQQILQQIHNTNV